MRPEKSILIVDDEPDILEFARYNLEKEGFKVTTASNGREAVDLSEQTAFDLIILDVMMPEMDGIQACQEIRSHGLNKSTVISFLTARGEDYSEVAGFEAGADDYIVKPIRPRVLISRIHALLRRNGDESSEVQSIGNLEIDQAQFLIRIDGREETLPKKEFELLSLLASAPGKVFTREQIMNRIWGGDVIVGDRTIDVHIRKLRSRLGEEAIRTIKGVGYKFDLK
jgi:two-component system alkaline phosphatase synthesis response regulator PhoP